MVNMLLKAVNSANCDEDDDNFLLVISDIQNRLQKQQSSERLETQNISEWSYTDLGNPLQTALPSRINENVITYIIGYIVKMASNYHNCCSCKKTYDRCCKYTF